MAVHGRELSTERAEFHQLSTLKRLLIAHRESQIWIALPKVGVPTRQAAYPPVGGRRPPATAVLSKRIPAFTLTLSGLPFGLFTHHPACQLCCWLGVPLGAPRVFETDRLRTYHLAMSKT
jgi:hypothetical protein